MSLLGELLSEARKAELGYGIHQNVVLTAADNEQRKTKDGEKINRNTYLTFSQLDDKGNIVAEKEISWFNLDPTSEYLIGNFMAQLEQMTAIMDIYHPVTSSKDKWMAKFSKLLEKYDIEEGEEETTENVEQLKADLKEILSDKESCQSFMNDLSDAFCSMVGKKMGKDSQPMRFKVVFDYRGKYLQQPKYNAFVESMEIDEEDSVLKMTDADEENRQKSLVSKKPSAPVGKL